MTRDNHVSHSSCGVGPASFRGGRHFLLEAPNHSGAVRFLSGLHVILQDGKTSSWVTVTRTGRFRDPRYGEFEITKAMLLSMVENFDKRTYGQDIFIDVAHQPSNGAAGKVAKLSIEGDRLRALVEWTPYGVEAIRGKGYVYLSAEYHENFQDNETGAKHGPVLLGAGLTVRPVIKRLDPIQLSESGGGVPTLLHPELQLSLTEEIKAMWKELLKQLSEKLKSFKLADAVVESLAAAAEKAVGGITVEADAKALMAAFEASGKQLAEQVGDKVIQLSIDVPALKGGLTAEDVKKLMAEETARQADEAKKLVEQRDGNAKLLADTIGAAKDLPDALKQELTEAVADLVTAGMTADQVKRLAEAQIASGNRIEAARKLAAMGFQHPAGQVHISVDDSNAVKALQEAVDRRLGFAGMPDSRRFAATGGQLQEANKDIVEKVLAQYERAARPPAARRAQDAGRRRWHRVRRGGAGDLRAHGDPRGALLAGRPAVRRCRHGGVRRLGADPVQLPRHGGGRAQQHPGV